MACLAGLPACAGINEVYYVAAHDPASESPNYYRIKIKGTAGASKVKYSTGYYDRAVIERLFGEFAVQREYEDPDAVNFQQLQDQLAQAQFASNETRVVLLREANAKAAALIAQHRVLVLRRKLAPAIEIAVKAELDKLGDLHRQASEALDEDEVKPGAASKAMHLIREIEGAITQVRALLDDGVVVRFFDGAGNAIDTTNKVQVIFVATNVSQFTTAFQNIQDIEQDKEDLIELLTADRAKAANSVRARMLESQRHVRDIHARLDTIIAKDAPQNVDELRTRALEAAAALADRPGRFDSAGELETYVKGEKP